MSPPLVSVIIATWNTGTFLPETLASALAQTWQDLEVIVVDDGSTDGTREAIEEFLPRIRYESRPHLGLAAARNEGIRLAGGEYIALLDADDLWHPDTIATQVDVATRHPEAGMIVCNGVEFSDEGVLTETLLSEPFTRAIDSAPRGEIVGDFHRDLISGWFISCPAQVLLPRRVVQEIGPFTDSNSQDYEYYLRLSLRYPFAVHSHSHVRWRYRPNSMSGNRPDRPVQWTRSRLPLLRDHRSRCRPQDRHLVEASIRRHVGILGRGLVRQGRRDGTRLAATSQLLRILRWHRWPPTALLHLVELWSPTFVLRTGRRFYRLLARQARREPRSDSA